MPAMKAGTLAIAVLFAWHGCTGSSELPSNADAYAGEAKAADGSPEQPVQFPGDSWPTGDPGDFGLDVAELDRAASHAESIGSQCLLVVRDGVLVREGVKISSLRRFKDDVKEVRANMECGLKLEGFDDVHVGDVIETYEIVKTARTL